MSIALTDEQVLSTLRDVAEESPEKVYEAPEHLRDEWGSCYYVHRDEDGNESAGCIVGTVLHRLGVPLAELRKAETYGADAAIPLIGVTGISASVSSFLRHVQRKQDRGQTWSNAVHDGLSDYNEICGSSLAFPEKAA
ncbi:hypothetical protein [Streptomyces afghaniensis]|uniref:hypothetical protein n=1 Tax=Streptomyces afghaniensis TaxID=66865 RepID=UPI00278154EE|nr:hypothetical protein [Streptomyces afghaniensis]MDQ1016674.1 hypothetical protein [Streptomyces afghaniensis]